MWGVQNKERLVIVFPKIQLKIFYNSGFVYYHHTGGLLIMVLGNPVVISIDRGNKEVIRIGVMVFSYIMRIKCMKE